MGMNGILLFYTYSKEPMVSGGLIARWMDEDHDQGGAHG